MEQRKQCNLNMDIALTFGLVVNITAKTKFVVTGHNVLDNDKAPIDLP